MCITLLIDQHALGFSMRVERADVSKVKEKMDALKRKLNEPESEKRSAVEIYEEKLENQLAEKERLKKLKKEREAALKKEREAAELEQGIDPEVAALMGFSGFK